MNISSTTSAYRSPPHAQKDNAAIATAQRTRNNTEEQKAVASLRRDAPSAGSERTERSENDHDQDDVRAQAARRQSARGTVGSALNVTA